MGDIFDIHGIVVPGRGKGTRMSRMGKKMSIAAHFGARATSPNEEALQQLNRLLEDHEGMPSDVRQQYVGLYRNSDSLRHMNRPVLAEVMVLMYQQHITADERGVNNLHVFSNPTIMQPYIDRILTRTETGDQRGRMPEAQKTIVSIKMTNTMFAYLRNILLLLATIQQRSQQSLLTEHSAQDVVVDQLLDNETPAPASSGITDTTTDSISVDDYQPATSTLAPRLF